jgi:hypothetical protein
MNEQSSGRSFGRTALAALVVIVAGYILLHSVLGIISWLLGIVLIVGAIVALIWALRVLL